MREIRKNYKTASIDKNIKVILRYAERLTKKPYSINKKDIEYLRESGLTDRDIFDVNQVASYFNYVNRIADGLGVELER